MKGKHTVILISPTVPFLALAAACRQEWDALQIAGRRRIVAVLEGCLRDKEIGRLLVLVPEVADPAAVRGLLARFCRAGRTVLWFAPTRSASVRTACAGVCHARLVQGPDTGAAVAAEFPPDRGMARQLAALDEETPTWSISCGTGSPCP